MAVLVSPSLLTEIYTDGACRGNPGPGGWGVMACFADGSVYELGGGQAHTTNNRMELQAAIAALEFLIQVTGSSSPESSAMPPPQPGRSRRVSLYSDSQYVINGIEKWIGGWRRKGWKTASGQPVLNQDLWEMLDRLNQIQPVQWRYVRGHSGNAGNERCDVIARAYAAGKSPKLIQCSLPLDAGAHSAPDLEPGKPSDASVKSGLPDRNAPPTCAPSAQMSMLSLLESEVAPSPVVADAPRAIADPDLMPHSSFAGGDMSDSNASYSNDLADTLSREARVTQLRCLAETLRIADEIAEKGYLIASSELADLMDVNASAVTSRGDNWVWRNWIVTRVRREGNQILWQLERIED